VTEAEEGGLLTRDHFKPLTQQGRDSVDNMVYACADCNRAKEDTSPSLRGNGYCILGTTTCENICVSKQTVSFGLYPRSEKYTCECWT
jgi:hypothetical protein